MEHQAQMALALALRRIDALEQDKRLGEERARTVALVQQGQLEARMQRKVDQLKAEQEKKELEARMRQEIDGLKAEQRERELRRLLERERQERTALEGRLALQEQIRGLAQRLDTLPVHQQGGVLRPLPVLDNPQPQSQASSLTFLPQRPALDDGAQMETQRAAIADMQR